MGAATLALIAVFAVACATTRSPSQPQPNQTLHGMASWYGEEYAGRTTANGEIFDPTQLTAAHRTLPFGTLVEVKNPKNGQTVRVRINDRGPFVGNRMIDLSYAAAQRLGLIDPGSGEVDVVIVSVGRGDREPPAPYGVTIAEPREKVKVPSSEPPKIDFPLPAQVALKPAAKAGSEAKTATKPGSDADFKVEVVEERGGTPTRKQVGPDGKTIVAVPAEGTKAAAEKPRATSAAADRAAGAEKTQQAVAPAEKPRQGKFVVQVGAFSVEANATALQDRLTKIGQKSLVVFDTLYRVRIGPFDTRDEAVKVRTTLETNGISAIVVGD